MSTSNLSTASIYVCPYCGTHFPEAGECMGPVGAGEHRPPVQLQEFVPASDVRQIQKRWTAWIDSRPDGWEDQPDDPIEDALDMAIMHPGSLR